MKIHEKINVKEKTQNTVGYLQLLSPPQAQQ